MPLDVHRISLIYDFWKLNTEDDYMQDVTELSKKLIESDSNDAESLRRWIPEVLQFIQCWEERELQDLDEFYGKLLDDPNAGDQVDALLRFLYDIQNYEMVKYLLEKNVQHYKQAKIVSSSMTGFHEACFYGFSQVCALYIRERQDVNEPFSLIYTHCKSNEKELIRNLTGLQLVCLWSKYFPKRLLSYAHTVRLLLNHGARVNMTSSELTTALHWVCRAQHTTQLAQDLIDAGACIDALDRINVRPIHYACWARNRTIVELLLRKGARLTVQDDLGRTPMHFLCMPKYAEAICAADQQDQVELLKCLLKYNEQTPSNLDFKQKDNHGYTFLGYACISHNLPLIELLLEYEPELLNEPTLDGQTPLMISINEGFIEGVEYFLRQSNLERNFSDHRGDTAIHYACRTSKSPAQLNILRMLLEDRHGQFDLEKRNEESHDPLITAVIGESIEVSRLLLEHRVTVTKTDLHGRQALHLACQLGNYELVSLLLQAPGININAVDDCHRNCLFYAISSGHVELVKLLVQNRVVIQIRDRIGDTPLHLTVQQTNHAAELTRVLLETDAGKSLINIPAADGMRPLLLAAQSKQADVIHLLLKAGADPKAVDPEHHTALHLACRSACMMSAFYLIEVGGLDVNALDCYRQTPIFYAFASNDYDLVQYLMTCGAKIDLRDNQNYLPLHVGLMLSDDDKEFNLNLIDVYKNRHEALLDDQKNECQVTPLILASMQGKFNVVQHLVLHSKVNVMAKCSNGHTPLHYASLSKHKDLLKIIRCLNDHGCTYEKVDQPKGSFLYTVLQYGNRKAVNLFLDFVLQRDRDINALQYDSSVLDLLYDRAQLQHHDLDIAQLRTLLERGAHFYRTSLPIFPCPLINDCPQFHLLLLEYNAVSIVEKSLYIYQLLHSIASYHEVCLLFNRDHLEWISVCDYFLRVVQCAHYYYQVKELFVTIERQFLPILHSQQASEQVHQLQGKLEQLRSTPLKLGEIARKRIRLAVPVPSKDQFKALGFTGVHLDFLVQTRF